MSNCDKVDKEKLKSQVTMSRDPALIRERWLTVLQHDLENENKSLPTPKIGCVVELPEEVARTMWAIQTLSKLKQITEPHSE